MADLSSHAAAQRPRSFGHSGLPILTSFALGLAVGIVCRLACGVSLGLFFGPILLLPFLVPHWVTGDSKPTRRILNCLALAAGVWLVWITTANLSLMDAFRCGLVLCGFVLSLAGLAAVLERVHLGKTFAASMTSLLGILWLTWPIWLCSWLDGPRSQITVNELSVAHPLMAMNSILFSRFNFWDRYTMSYQQLTILNQDVLYSLPGTIAWMVLLHLGLAAVGLAPSIRFMETMRKGRGFPVASNP